MTLRDRTIRWRNESLPLSGWAQRAGLPESTLRLRLQRGLSLDVATTAPRLSAAARGRMGRRASSWR